MTDLTDADLPPELGRPGVESVTVGSDGGRVIVFDPNQTRVQWPGIRASSAVFKDLPTPLKFYEQAIAFLDSAKVLCESAGVKGANGIAPTWSQGSVCYYCLHIATELFLKACVLQAGREAPKSHRLRDLYAEYERVLPGNDYHFSIPLQWLQAAESFERPLDRSPDQLYRYGLGLDGRPSAYIHVFSPDMVFNRLAQLLRVWPRAWHALQRLGA